MKSTPLESLDSEVFQAVSGVFVGPFAPDQRANNCVLCKRENKILRRLELRWKAQNLHFREASK